MFRKVKDLVKKVGFFVKKGTFLHQIAENLNKNAPFFVKKVQYLNRKAGNLAKKVEK
jgi:hypothetical protein